MRDSLPAFALIVAALGIMILVDPEGLSPGNVIWAALQVAAVLWMGWVQARSLTRADEYQRVVRLEALAIGFGTVMVTLVAAGALEALGIGNPRQSLQVTTGAGVLAWVVAQGLLTRKAR
jgi:hypothetical protein